MLPVTAMRMLLVIELSIAEETQKRQVGLHAEAVGEPDQAGAAAGRHQRGLGKARIAQQPVGHALDQRLIALQHAALDLQFGGIAHGIVRPDQLHREELGRPRLQGPPAGIETRHDRPADIGAPVIDEAKCGRRSGIDDQQRRRDQAQRAGDVAQTVCAQLLGMRQVELEIALEPRIDREQRNCVAGLGDHGFERRHDGGQNHAVRHFPDVPAQGIAETIAAAACGIRPPCIADRCGSAPRRSAGHRAEQAGDRVGIADVEQQPVFRQWPVPSRWRYVPSPRRHTPRRPGG